MPSDWEWLDFPPYTSDKCVLITATMHADLNEALHNMSIWAKAEQELKESHEGMPSVVTGMP